MFIIPGSGFTRPGLRIDNSVLTGETSRRPGSARHGIPVADPFQDRDLLQPQGVWLWFGDIRQWAPIATRCEALGKVPNMKFVTITMKTKPASSLALVVKINKVSLYAFDSTRTNLLHF